MKFSIYQESRIGGRKANEDRCGYSYSRDALLMVVADGMGGHLHGEVASQIALQFLSEAFAREARPKLADPFLFLLRNINGAHDALLDYAQTRSLTEAPRTTCVAAVVQDGAAYWAHAGDSRLYHLRRGRILARTRDHSRVQMLIDAGRIREEAAAHHPERNRIFNCLGGEEPPRVELSRRVGLDHQDTLLLCSDGLWGPLSAGLMTGVLVKDHLLKAVPALMTLAEERAGPQSDNISVVAMTWADDASVTMSNQVSTGALEPGGIASRVGDIGADAGERQAGNSVPAELSDAEIERAIAEIRSAIKRHSSE
jgi:serine/threonine protein phosphatase PrpC